MPIRPENKERYPSNWKEISERIRFKRAKNHCEICNIENYSLYYFYRNSKIVKFSAPYSVFNCDNDYKSAVVIRDSNNANPDNYRLYLTVLTVAHLNHTPEDNREENLKAMCQTCHNNHDKTHRAQTRKLINNLNQSSLF